MAPKKEAVGESADDLAAEVFRKNDLLDVRESAFAAEHFQLGLKYIFTKQSGEHVEAPQEERSIAQLLVNCVSRVVAVNKVNRLQEGLQALLSEFMKRKKSSDGMTCEGQPRFLSDYTQCHQYVAQEKEGLRKAMQGWPSEKRAPSCSPMRKLALAGNYEKLCHEEPGVPWSGGLPVFSKGTRSQRVRRRAKNRVVAEDEVRLRPSTTWTKAAEMASSLAKDFLIQQSSSMAGFFLGEVADFPQIIPYQDTFNNLDKLLTNVGNVSCVASCTKSMNIHKAAELKREADIKRSWRPPDFDNPRAGDVFITDEYVTQRLRNPKVQRLSSAKQLNEPHYISASLPILEPPAIRRQRRSFDERDHAPMQAYFSQGTQQKWTLPHRPRYFEPHCITPGQRTTNMFNPHDSETSINLSHCNVKPEELVTYATGVEWHRRVDVDISENRLLDDQAITAFLATLGRAPEVHITRFKAERVAIGMGSLTALLHRGMHLIELNLTSCLLSRNMWQLMRDRVEEMPLLSVLNLSNTRCGLVDYPRQDSAVCAGELVRMAIGLRRVNFSHNAFSLSGCMALAYSLRSRDNDTLEALDMSYNACSVAQSKTFVTTGTRASSPLLLVLEALGDSSLREVAFCGCNLAYESDCVLEDVVPRGQIRILDMCDNPHGDEGARCLVRLLARTSQLELVKVDHLHPCVLQPHMPFFNFTDPTREYVLDLGEPQHRSVFRLLLQRCDDKKVSLGACFSRILFNRAETEDIASLATKQSTKSGGTAWQVAQSGQLTFLFTDAVALAEVDNVDAVFRTHERKNRMHVDFSTFDRIWRTWISICSTSEQQMLLHAMSKDLSFKLCQVKRLAMSSCHSYDIVMDSLLPTLSNSAVLISSQFSRRLVFDAERTGAQSSFQACVRWFNPLHCDGHYRLETCADRDAVWERLRILSTWMQLRAVRLALVDVSQHGNYESIRNLRSLGRDVTYTRSWVAPVEGLLECDFFSIIKLDKAIPVVKNSVLKDFKKLLQAAELIRLEDKLHVLGMVAHHFTVSPKQLPWLIELFPMVPIKDAVDLSDVPLSFLPRVNLFTLLFNRCHKVPEIISPSVLYNLEYFAPIELTEIRRRLGKLRTFDARFFSRSPETNLVVCNFDLYEERRIALFIFLLAAQEPGENMTGCSYVEDEIFGTEIVFVVPASWLTQMPSVGTFRVRYRVDEKSVNLTQRLNLAKQILGWT
eukprot:GEMP01004268.1.p1 GENE.GEMP01004268.1~~GEMP01004268.1.p1  ORF type:complete len:1212 (+),score=221.92 GEMP01004268.1:127-3762(+)